MTLPRMLWCRPHLLLLGIVHLCSCISTLVWGLIGRRFGVFVVIVGGGWSQRLLRSQIVLEQLLSILLFHI